MFSTFFVLYLLSGHVMVYKQGVFSYWNKVELQYYSGFWCTTQGFVSCFFNPTATEHNLVTHKAVHLLSYLFEHHPAPSFSHVSDYFLRRDTWKWGNWVKGSQSVLRLWIHGANCFPKGLCQLTWQQQGLSFPLGLYTSTVSHSNTF